MHLKTQVQAFAPVSRFNYLIRGKRTTFTKENQTYERHRKFLKGRTLTKDTKIKIDKTDSLETTVKNKEEKEKWLQLTEMY